jgi:anthranilate phosphoribosyltransferase
VGFCFLFAPYYHPTLKHVAAVRRELGIPTLFNLVGPLCNPAGARRQVIGVFSLAGAEVVARALAILGTDHALVVHGSEGADEITPTGAAAVWEVRNGSVERGEIDPQKLGFERCALADLRGGDAARNAALLREILSGAAGPIADAVALNAGAALYVGAACESVGAGVERAREVLRSGQARQRLERFVDLSRRTAERAIV